MSTSTGLLSSVPPSLVEQFKRRANQLRSNIIRANYKTQFIRTASELTEFRYATASGIDQVEDDALSESFQQTAHLTTYDSYSPYVARFSEKPCRASAVVDLLAPGLPNFLVESSSTSGGLPKTFPKYNCMSKIRSSNAGLQTISEPHPSRRRTTANIFWLAVDTLGIENGDGDPVTIYRTIGTVVIQRLRFFLDPEKDGEKMGTFILDHVAPYATGFIKNWRSFLLIHVLFAIGSRSLETMVMPFVNTFVDMIRHLDVEYKMMVDCIANGTIPDLEGIAEVRGYLEINMSPDPQRAEELRGLGRPSSVSGWCGRVWPNLRSVTTIASGSFTSTVPLAQWFLGLSAEIHPLGYVSSEAWVGLPYSPLELNQFKLNGEDIVEFLDIDKSDSISSLAQPWEVELGRRYEVVVTTQHGLWRYRLGDVVEISGFDPMNGGPIIQFVERRNVVIRFPNCMITEEELQTAISSLTPNILTKVVNWTSTIDDRHAPSTIGFFVELADDQVLASEFATAPDRVFDALLRSSSSVAWAVAHGIFRKPTIRLVRPGTFSDFRQLKYDEGNNNLGQIKVPVVLSKPGYVAWVVDRVLQEL